MMRWPRLSDSGSRGLLVFSLCLMSLVYGVVAGHYDLFPHSQLRDAKAAATALIRVLNKDDGFRQDVAPLSRTGPAVRSYGDVDDGALILVSGGPKYRASPEIDEDCLAWLMDRRGEIRHVWTFPPDLWTDLEKVSRVPFTAAIYPVGVHLLEDGGLLASFQGTDAWPFGIGMARLDRESNLVWQKEVGAHHWFTVTPDHKIITPTMRVLDSPQPIGSTRGRIVAEDGRILEDFVTVMSLDGEILEEISMLEAVHRSGLIGLYQGASSGDLIPTVDVNTFDPLHLNFVRQVGEQVASAHEWLNADDLLVSFRSVNTVAILDRATSRFKWISTGSTLRQHSPRFLDSDRILVFDNLGGDDSLGGTRLAVLDLQQRLASTLFPTRDDPPPLPVISTAAGHLDIHRGGHAVLMTVTEQSRVLEIDLNEGKPLWEYSYLDPVDRQPRLLYTAKYCYDVSFPMNQSKAVE